MKEIKQFIGRKETVSFPEFDLLNQVAKIDSGAYTSSIHIDSARIENNQLVVQFSDEEHHVVRFDHWTKKKVKSSNGITDERYSIEVQMGLGANTYKTVFTLNDRAKMKYPILLGRKILSKYFFIDTSKVNLLSKS